jgi:alkanesulfonate monooxygenase SsuD/methylene tetrahydromethanopterin reductase-like flavin-dependent oxidoreductase (luciferase family)
MKYGFIFPGNDARAAVEFAVEAEAAGWHGFFVWDAVWGVDPWVTLGAIAARTQKIRMGTMLTPLSRRRPWKLAGETVTVDQLSNGRLILAVGLGAPDTGFAAFGEATDRQTRAELLDEGLAILTGLWRGLPLDFAGQHYRVQVQELFSTPPPPVQQPRIPIWVVGAWPRPKSMARVLRYDGLLPNKMVETGPTGAVTAADVRAMKAYIDAHRQETTPFDIVLEGETDGDDREKAVAQLRPLVDAGMTWWLEARWSTPDLDKVLTRIRQGPPHH